MCALVSSNRRNYYHFIRRQSHLSDELISVCSLLGRRHALPIPAFDISSFIVRSDCFAVVLIVLLLHFAHHKPRKSYPRNWVLSARRHIVNDVWNSTFFFLGPSDNVFIGRNRKMTICQMFLFLRGTFSFSQSCALINDDKNKGETRRSKRCLMCWRRDIHYIRRYCLPKLRKQNRIDSHTKWPMIKSRIRILFQRRIETCVSHHFPLTLWL